MSSEEEKHYQLQTLWTDYQDRKRAKELASANPLNKIPDKAVLWAVLIASVLGVGPDFATNLIKVLTP